MIIYANRQVWGLMKIKILFLTIVQAGSWCMQQDKAAPCHGAPGYCSRNSDRSLGGFVARSAKVPQKKGLNEPYLALTAQVCGHADLARNVKILDHACIDGYAIVTGSARVGGKALVKGRAYVGGSATVGGCAVVDGKALITENALVEGDAHISDNAKITGHALIAQKAWVHGNAEVSGSSIVRGSSVVAGNVMITDRVIVTDNARVTQSAVLVGSGRISGHAIVAGRAKVEGQPSITGVVLDEASVGGESSVMGIMMQHAKIDGRAKLYGVLRGDSSLTDDAQVDGVLEAGSLGGVEHLASAYRMRPDNVSHEAAREMFLFHATKKLFRRLKKDYKLYQRFSLSQDYRVAKNVLDSLPMQRFFREKSVFVLNYAMIAQDPYLFTHNFASTVDCDDMTDKEWMQLAQKLKKTKIVHESFFSMYDLDVIFRRLMIDRGDSLREHQTKHFMKKKIKSLVELASDSLDTFVIELTQHADRCLTGLQEGLRSMEEATHREYQDHQAYGLRVDDGAQFVSRVLTDYKMDFIREHANFRLKSSEYRTTAVAILMQRMIYALGLRGEEAQVFHYEYGSPSQRELQPGAVMQRFILGGTDDIGFNSVTFPAYTPQFMVKLLADAYDRGFQGRSMKTVLTNESLTAICREDPYLWEVYEQFADDQVQPFFQATTTAKIHIQEDFWIYLLVKYGYLQSVS